MEEYSLSFLVKDRYLDDKKRQWVQEHVRRRECVQFVSPEDASDDKIGGFTTKREPDLDNLSKSLCRCGRQHDQHLEHQSPDIGCRDYRLFSKHVSTDVCVEVVNTEGSKFRPVSYAPKQVIRLAADSEVDVLRQLIGQIWHLPKVSFLVSVYGSSEGVQYAGRLSDNLSTLLRVLSNPGSVVLTVSLTDLDLYHHVLDACDVIWTQLPYAEILPVVFLSWAALPDPHKDLLRALTQLKEGVEHGEIPELVNALFRGKKGYFLLADYGVHADLSFSPPPSTASPPSAGDGGEYENVPYIDRKADDDRYKRGHKTADEESPLFEGGENTAVSQHESPTGSGEPVTDDPLYERCGAIVRVEPCTAGTPVPSASSRGGGAEVTGVARKNEFFSYSFPHPLRGRVDTLLKSHTHDTEGQGSLVMLYGATSFLDLAAAHGAIRSGIPVIFDMNGTGATAFLLAVMREVEPDDAETATELVSENRPFVTNEAKLKEKIEEHSSKLKDAQRYKSQMFRVIRDIVNNRHLVTICDLDGWTAPVTAAVEAFIKARNEEDAVLFIKKNTLRVAAEDDDHPVKKAQREFQKAVIVAATKLNRPELLDVVAEDGFVSDSDVFGEHERVYLSSEERQVLLADDSIPFSKIKDLRCFEARECFVQRVCKLKKGVKLNDRKPSTVVLNMFLYAVLNGRTLMAKHFWKQANFQDHVAHAVVASHLSSYLADKMADNRQAQVFRQQAEEFENLAKGTLTDCYVQDSKKASAIVIETAEAFGLSPIEAAISFQMRSLVAHPASSDFLDSVWKGEDMTRLSEPEKNPEKKPPGCRRVCSPLVKFFTAPRTICFLSTVFYVIFLTLYGHMNIFEVGNGQLSPLDITLLVWIVSFLVEEIIQFLSPKTFLMTAVTHQSGFSGKLYLYFSDPWNVLDALCLVFFILGYVLRLTVPESEAGHVILSLVYILFFLRLLRVLTVSRSIGPMLPMIWNMLGDLVPFLIILFVFVFAYGLASEALLHPGTTWHGLYFLYLPRVAFWPIFGEYGLEAIDGAGCQNNTLWYTEGGADVQCPSQIGRHVVPVLLGVYILITNVLMLNLLIAYFNHSFEKVHNESNIWWAWLRCGLIGEYYARPPLPPPFVLLYRVGQAVSWIPRKLWWCCCRIRASRDSDGSLMYGLGMNARGWGEEDLVLYSLRQVHDVFREEADVLDILDLEDFRFSNLGRDLDHKTAFLSECSPIPGSDEEEVHSMSELKRWEAAKASSRLQVQAARAAQQLQDEQRSKSSSKKQPLQEGLEEMLLRLEKKIEDNKEQLKSLHVKLTPDDQ